MKIAILILAHKNVWQLEKLVERLHTDFHIYIHIDKKCKLDKNIFTKYQNLYFVNQFNVNWGSFTQIRATLELFKVAHQSNYNYYMLISGQDIPLKSNSEIIDFLVNNKYANFVNSEKLPKKDWAGQNGGFDRVDFYFGNDLKKKHHRFNHGKDSL